MIKLLLVSLFLLTVKPLQSQSIVQSLTGKCHQAQKNEPPKKAIHICQQEKLKAYSNQDIEQTVSTIKTLISLNTKIDQQHIVEDLFIELESVADSDSELYEALRDQGKYFYHSGDFIKAEEYFKKGLEVAKDIAEPAFIAKSLNEMGLIHLRNLNYKKALTYFHESLDIKSVLDYEEGQAITTRNIALVYYRLSDYEKALNFYLEALKGYESALQTNQNDTVLQGRVTHINTDLAAVYSRLGNTELSRQAINKVNSAIERLDDTNTQASRLIDLAEGLIAAQDFEVAREFLYKANQILGDIKNSNYSRLYYLLGKTEFEIKNYTSAAIYTNKSMSMAETFSDNLTLLKVYKLYSELLATQQDFQGAYENYKKHAKITQVSNEQKFNDNLSQVKYRLETELNEKLLLKKDNELLVSDAENVALKLYLYSASVLIFFILFLIFYIVKVNKQKRKQLTLELKIHKEKLQELDKPIVNFKNLFADVKDDLIICNDAGFLVFSNILSLKPLLDTKYLNIQEISDELNAGLESTINHNNPIEIEVNSFPEPNINSFFTISPLLNGDYYIFSKTINSSLPLSVTEKINVLNRFSQSLNSLVIDKNDTGLLRPVIVDTMTFCVDTWINLTSTNKVEFADQSKIWKVNVDEGRLRTRSLDKYLSLNTLPKQPRLKNVIKTCHFLLSNKEVASSDRVIIESQLNKILAFDKS